MYCGTSFPTAYTVKVHWQGPGRGCAQAGAGLALLCDAPPALLAVPRPPPPAGLLAPAHASSRWLLHEHRRRVAHD